MMLQIAKAVGMAAENAQLQQPQDVSTGAADATGAQGQGDNRAGQAAGGAIKSPPKVQLLLSVRQH